MAFLIYIIMANRTKLIFNDDVNELEVFINQFDKLVIKIEPIEKNYDFDLIQLDKEDVKILIEELDTLLNDMK
jgi:hypothetical protein